MLPSGSQFDEWRRAANQLAERLRNRQQLAAVFGAFSAGKSSLINALVGEPVLVVSPNPTTAAVTHVASAGPDTPADTVWVTAKTASAMESDVFRACGRLGLAPGSLAEAASLGRALRPLQGGPPIQQAAAFLRAFANGYEQMGPRLGSRWPVPLAQARAYCADENVACFVERVDWPHTAPFLNSGLVLVDTPGVDSIHQRHTQLAFDYVRQADAVLFVLYYTHAFSRADKDFLLQLAGIQDVIGLNKLFVVINAVDLAKSAEERSAVRERVVAELRALGLRDPRVYEVSSQLGLAARMLERNPADGRFVQLVRQRLKLPAHEPLPTAADLWEHSGLDHLLADLRSYMREQADAVAMAAVERVIAGARSSVEAAWHRWQAEAVATQAEQARVAERRRAWQAELAAERAKVEAGSSVLEAALQAEWEELVFHIGERIRFRLPALFREAFHPGRFHAGTAARQALAAAAQELAAALSRQVEVETRTLALRLQSQVDQVIQRRCESLAAEAVLLGVDVPTASDPEAAPEAAASEAAGRLFAVPSVELDWTPFQATFRHFSNPKQFFEGGGQGEMLRDLEDVALPMVRDAVQRLADQLRAGAVQRFRDQLTAQLERTVRAAEAAGESLTSRTPGASVDSRQLEAARDWFRHREPAGVSVAR